MINSWSVYHGGVTLTNERLYESNDSLEIEKGSISARPGFVFVDVDEGFLRDVQKPFFSGGDGYDGIKKGLPQVMPSLTGKYIPLSLTTVHNERISTLCIG